MRTEMLKAFHTQCAFFLSKENISSLITGSTSPISVMSTPSRIWFSHSCTQLILSERLLNNHMTSSENSPHTMHTLLWHTAQLKIIYCIYQGLLTAYQKGKNSTFFTQQIDSIVPFRSDALTVKHTGLSSWSSVSTESGCTSQELQSQSLRVRQECTYSNVKSKQIYIPKKILQLLNKYFCQKISNISCRVNFLPWFVT